MTKNVVAQLACRLIKPVPSAQASKVGPMAIIVTKRHSEGCGSPSVPGRVDSRRSAQRTMSSVTSSGTMRDAWLSTNRSSRLKWCVSLPT